MLLKAHIKCLCGCSYELVSSTNRQSVACPNCGCEFSSSDELVEILNAFQKIYKKRHDFFALIDDFEEFEISTIPE